VSNEEPATVIDVAKAAGATPRDVALVVAADQRVPAELRQRIVEAITSRNYRPLRAATARLGRPPRFAVVLKVAHGDNPGENRFYTPIASAIAHMCAAHGAEVVPRTMRVDDRFRLPDLPADICEGGCDGAFILGADLSAVAVERIRAQAPPLVLVDGYSDGSVPDSVVTDNVAGGKMAVEHLIAAGHTEIGLLGTEPVCYPSIQGRRTGYAEALAGHGLQPHYIDTPYHITDPAAIVGLNYLSQHPEVTAIFGANDVITVALMQMARDAGYEIPGDLSLVGFDDIDLASLVIPALTTMSVDRTVMGRAGFALLAYRLDVPGADQLTSVVEPRLVERESVAPPPGR
jgi:DNA-binding LacI/PurR family transcriptional regulator